MELDMEMDEGQPQGCPFLGGDGSDEFGESTLPGFRHDHKPGNYHAGTKKNPKKTKGGGE